MPIKLIEALRLLAAARGLRDPVAILRERQDKTPRRPPIAWWLR